MKAMRRQFMKSGKVDSNCNMTMQQLHTGFTIFRNQGVEIGKNHWNTSNLFKTWTPEFKAIKQSFLLIFYLLFRSSKKAEPCFDIPCCARDKDFDASCEACNSLMNAFEELTAL